MSVLQQQQQQQSVFSLFLFFSCFLICHRPLLLQSSSSSTQGSQSRPLIWWSNEKIFSVFFLVFVFFSRLVVLSCPVVSNCYWNGSGGGGGSCSPFSLFSFLLFMAATLVVVGTGRQTESQTQTRLQLPFTHFALVVDKRRKWEKQEKSAVAAAAVVWAPLSSQSNLCPTLPSFFPLVLFLRNVFCTHTRSLSSFLLLFLFRLLFICTDQSHCRRCRSIVCCCFWQCLLSALSIHRALSLSHFATAALSSLAILAPH